VRPDLPRPIGGGWRWAVRRCKRWLVLAPVVALLATSCNGTEPSVAPSYLAELPNGVAFLEWTHGGSSLKGSITVAYIDPTEPTQVTSEQDAFSGGVLTMVLHDASYKWEFLRAEDGKSLDDGRTACHR